MILLVKQCQICLLNMLNVNLQISKFFIPSVADDPFGETDCSTPLKIYLFLRMNFSLSVDNTSTRCPKKYVSQSYLLYCSKLDFNCF